MFIAGESGQGKTYSLLTITSRLRYLGVQNFIIAPDKQDEFRRICDAVGGSFIDLAATSNQRINPFDIRPMTSPETAFLGGEGYVEKSWVIDKVDNLKIWLSYLVKDLTDAEMTILETLLIRLYEDFGMTSDNDSIYEDKDAGTLKKMPVISDFYALLEEETAKGSLRSDIKIIMSRFITGACRNMNGQTNVDLDNKYIVFGIRRPERLNALPYSCS